VSHATVFQRPAQESVFDVLQQLAPDKVAKWGSWADKLEDQDIETADDILGFAEEEFEALPFSAVLMKLLRTFRQQHRKSRLEEELLHMGEAEAVENAKELDGIKTKAIEHTGAATATPSAPVAITINDGLLGMGMLKSGHPLYGLKFSHFTEKGTAEQQAAGRLVKDMVLTDVSSKEIKGMGYEETKKQMSHRPITLTFQLLKAANTAVTVTATATATPPDSQTFKFQSITQATEGLRGEFDRAGVLYSIGTNNGRKAYANPHCDGEVVARMSSIDGDSRVFGASERFVTHSYDYTNFVDAGNCTKDERDSWMSVDLGHRALCVNHYSLRHGNNSEFYRLRYWVLEGSNDGGTWVSLREHRNDKSLPKSGYGVAHWDVTGVKMFYNQFRIRNTGKKASNSKGVWSANNQLYCAGIELYGELRHSL
jgi:hypothetical protein